MTRSYQSVATACSIMRFDRLSMARLVTICQKLTFVSTECNASIGPAHGGFILSKKTFEFCLAERVLLEVSGPVGIVVPPLGFLEVQVEGASGQALELRQPSLG